jgi:hypothetical protein
MQHVHFFCSLCEQWMVFYQSDSSRKGENNVTNQYIGARKTESQLAKGLAQCL